MAILKTNCGSLTGNLLYSDTYAKTKGLYDSGPSIYVMPTLNTLAAIPLLGPLAGILRVALAIIHMIGHTVAALIFWNTGHFCHVAKGGTELLRGVIEMIPIVGRLFAWFYDARAPLIPTSQSSTKYSYSWFILKISNPFLCDEIDRYLMDQGMLSNRHSNQIIE
jgi:hypothetical protein